MIKILSKKSFDAYESRINNLERELEEAKKKLVEQYERNENLEFDFKRLQEQFFSANENEVTLKIKDDLLTVIPFVKWKPEIKNKLVEIGYLNEYPPPGEKAIQLALISIAYEALEQIIESFSYAVQEVDKED